MKINKTYLLFSFLITCILIETDAITFRTVLDNSSEHLPDLFGFPFIYKTSTPWVNSFEQEVYVKGLLLNIFFWLLLIYPIIVLSNKINLPKILYKATAFLLLFFGILAIISFTLNPFEHKTFFWDYSFDLKKSEITLEFFSTSNEKY